jgi:hypothetical protein
MIKYIEQIIQDGVMAPSGENCQPWKFLVKNKTLHIFNLPKRDVSLYNLNQQGSYIAHGALIENICISAKQFGYLVKVSLFPDDTCEDLVASLSFEEADKEEDGLLKSIHTRTTNRKQYDGRKLSDLDKQELLGDSHLSEGDAFIILDEVSSIKKISDAVALNERIVFENKKIHTFFYTHLLWDKKDEDKAGFFVDTLEFLPHQKVMVKAFSSWKLVSLLNAMVGVGKLISKDNAKKYASSSAFGIFLMQGRSPKDYIRIGRSVQRMWLSATKKSMAVHPCNGTVYCFDQITHGDKDLFSKKHRTLIEKAYKDILNEVSPQNKGIGFVCRIGFAENPTAKAMRIFPEIEYTKE